MRLFVRCKTCGEKINLAQTVEERRFVSLRSDRKCITGKHNNEYYPHNVYAEKHIEFSLRSIFMASIIAFVFTLALGDIRGSFIAIGIAAVFRAMTDYYRCTSNTEVERINRFNTSWITVQ